jgi:hypothetical protein
MGFTIPQTTAAADVPAGAHDATITAIDQINGQYGPQVRIKFTLDGGETLSLYTSATFNAKSKLWAVVSAVFGREPGLGVAFNSDWLIGRHARILVGDHTRADGTTGSKIMAVLAHNQPTVTPGQSLAAALAQAVTTAPPSAPVGFDAGDPF